MATKESQKLKVIAISTSESPDMAVFGLSDGHLRDATAEIATYLLAFGADLAYGGDLRQHGFTELLFDLVLRYRRDGDGIRKPRVTSYLAWPVHILMTVVKLSEIEEELQGTALLALIDRDGKRLTLQERKVLPCHEPDDEEWTEGLTTMRRIMRDETDARILLGGRVESYKGNMPGIAEEALLSLESGQPIFLIGGFGGCTRDIAETLGLVDAWAGSRPAWPGRQRFECYGPDNLHNGLSAKENRVLAHTPHIDQAVTLVMQGLHRLRRGAHNGSGERGDGRA